ncbi:MAG: hypothetical protein IT259_04385, partial [Saprospiraceae bacterium]|nr:hypothetical protein [Saprospiraceae bacterium]
MANVSFIPAASSEIYFDICDLDFQVTIEICHYYTAEHQFEIQFDCQLPYINFVDNGALENVSETPLGGGVTRVSGTVTAPPAPDENTLVCPSFTFTFSRFGTWPGVLNNFRARVIDPSCDPPLQAEATYTLSNSSFIDLRVAPQTQLSALLAAGTIVPGSTGSLPDLYIDDELIIDVPALIQGSSGAYRDIVLMPGASIVIAEDAAPSAGTPYLNTQYAQFRTCPGDALSEGIIVEPRAAGSKVIQLNMQQSRITDARFGINAQPGSSLRIESTEFTNNYVGLHLDMTGAAAGQEQVSFLGFSGNTFSTAPGQALKVAYPGMPEAIEERGYCGIFLKNYRDFNVFGANSFERLANGIVATNTNLNVGNLTFSDMRHSGVVNAYPREGFGIHLSARNNSSWANIGLPWAPISFDDCKTAVFAERYAGKVEHCTMTGVDLGVDWQKSPTRDVRIRNNDITANR